MGALVNVLALAFVAIVAHYFVDLASGETSPFKLISPFLRLASFISRPYFDEEELEKALPKLKQMRSYMENGIPWMRPGPLCPFFLGIEICEMIAQTQSESAAGIEQIDVQLPSRDADRTIPAVCLFPVAGKSSPPLVIDFHAGGLVMGSRWMNSVGNRVMSSELGVAICSIEYRLAPEHRFPAATDDGYDAAIALLDTALPALEGRYDSSKVAIYGTSAGGYVGGVTALQLARAKRKVGVQILIVPMTKPFAVTESMKKYADQVEWTQQQNNWSWNVYLKDNLDASSQADMLSTTSFPDNLLARAPPAEVVLAEKDCLHDEGMMYVERLQSAGKLTNFTEFPTSHLGLGFKPHAFAVQTIINSAIRQHLGWSGTGAQSVTKAYWPGR